MGPPVINNTPVGVRFPLAKLPDLPLLSASQLLELPNPANQGPEPQLETCVYFRWANIATCLRVQWLSPSEVAYCARSPVSVKLWEFLSAQLESPHRRLSLGFLCGFQSRVSFLSDVDRCKKGESVFDSMKRIWFSQSVDGSVTQTEDRPCRALAVFETSLFSINIYEGVNSPLWHLAPAVALM